MKGLMQDYPLTTQHMLWRLERLFDRIVGADLRGGATLHGCHIRPAARTEKDFAPFSLVLQPESPRKTRGSAAPVV